MPQGEATSRPEPDQHRRVVVGIVADPDLATEIVTGLKDLLPDILRDRVRDTIDWEVELKSEALPLDEDGNITIWQNSARLKSDAGWDLLICVTELTRRSERSLLVSDISISGDAALISLPALGPIRLRHHVRNVMVRAVNAMITQDLQVAKDIPASGLSGLPGRLQTPVQNKTVDDGSVKSSAQRISGLRAGLRLLLGMVRINRPWRLVPSLASALAAAVATAAFGVFYSTIWKMADALSPLRLLVISLIAITAMVMWLIVYNKLWQGRDSLESGKDRSIYNASTVLTLLIGVACMYVVLFIVIFLGALTIIPSPFMEETLQHQSTVMNYISVAWLASSLGTFAGALGSTFESDYAIREATYGRREQERHAISDHSDG